MATKEENGMQYPRAAYAYAPDPEKPSGWKLRLWETPEKKETAAQVGRALAALGPGFRGNKVSIPSSALSGVKRKILAAWKKTHPGATSEQIPEILKGEFSMPFTLEELTAKLDGIEAQHSETLKRAERAEAIVKLSGEQRAVYDKLSETEKTAFLEGDAAVRETFMSKSVAEAAPEIDDLRKRAEAAEAVLKTLETRVALAENAARVELEKRQALEFQKRAESELSHYPGTIEKKGGVLAAIAKLAADEQAALMELINSGNAALKQLGTAVGTDARSSSMTSAWTTIQQKAAQLRAADPALSVAKATEMVVAQDPALYNQYLKEQTATA